MRARKVGDGQLDREHADRERADRAEPDRAEPDRAGLLDRRQFLRRSLEDLDQELETGEIEPEEHAPLARRDRALLEETEQLLAAIDAAPPPGSGAEGRGDGRAVGREAPPAPADAVRAFSRRHRKAIGVSAGACFAAALASVGLALGGVPPFTSTTSTTLPIATRIGTELAEAAALAENHNVVEAVAVYDDVLALDPRQPEALSEGGWLVRLAGISSHRQSLVSGGDREIADAVRIAPGLAVPRAYYGVALFEDRHDPSAAVAQFEAMLQDHPTSVLLRSVGAVAVKAFRAAGLPVPRRLSPAKKS